jgi:flagellar basal-body rod protein FlgG
MGTFSQLFNVSQSGMRLNMLDMDTISNNLANVNTDGFKSSRLDFQELLNQASLDGSRVANSQMNFAQGPLKNTGRDLDWAISGDGFFGIRKDNGQVAYTRNGNLQLDSSHNLVNMDGQPLIWNGTIPADAQKVEIDNSGNVSYALNSLDGARTVAGQVPLFRFANPSGLSSDGGNLLTETPASGTAISGQPNTNSMGTIVGFTLENSNVDMSEQFSHMLIVQRIYQSTAKALTQSNQMLSEAIKMRQG